MKIFIILRFDLYVNPGWQAQLGERIDDSGGGIDDVDQTAVDPDLELLAAFLVHEGRSLDGENLVLGRQRDRPGQVFTGPLADLDDLADRLVQQAVIVGSQFDAQFLAHLFPTR